MNVVIILIIIWAYSIIITSLIDLKWSLTLYLAYTILVPYMQFSIGSLTLSYNLVNTTLLLAFLIIFRFRKHLIPDTRYLIPFLITFFLLFLLTFFAQDTPWTVQLNYLRLHLMGVAILPLIVWNVGLTDPKALKYIKWTLVICFTIACFYGIYLTQLGGNNPYTSALAKYTGAEVDHAEVFTKAKAMTARLALSSAAKIQATMVHPMTWCIHLCFMIVVSFAFIYKGKDKTFLFLIPLLLFSVVISGVRTGIAAIIIGTLYFVIRSGKFKIIGGALLAAAFVYLFVIFSTDLKNLFASFTDVSGQRANVSGSSIAMRLHQLGGALDEVRGRELIGKGYGWTSYYHSIRGDHPVLLSFESLIFVLICNGGWIGSAIWCLLYYLIFRLTRKILTDKDSIILADTLLITYLAYAIGTGEYSYLQIFALYYIILMLLLLRGNTIDNFKKSVRSALWAQTQKS